MKDEITKHEWISISIFYPSVTPHLCKHCKCKRDVDGNGNSIYKNNESKKWSHTVPKCITRKIGKNERT